MHILDWFHVPVSHLYTVQETLTMLAIHGDQNHQEFGDEDYSQNYGNHLGPRVDGMGPIHESLHIIFGTKQQKEKKIETFRVKGNGSMIKRVRYK